MGLSVSDHVDLWGIIQASKRAANKKVRSRMAPELTRGLLESIEFAADMLAQHAATLRESHKNQDDVWDSDEIHAEHRACLAHTYRLECFAKSLAVVLRREERKAAAAAAVAASN